MAYLVDIGMMFFVRMITHLVRINCNIAYQKSQFQTFVKWKNGSLAGCKTAESEHQYAVQIWNFHILTSCYIGFRLFIYYNVYIKISSTALSLRNGLLTFPQEEVGGGRL